MRHLMLAEGCSARQDGSEDFQVRVRLTLTPGVVAVDTVTVSYTPGANKIQDSVTHKLAAALSNQAVTNDTSPPLFVETFDNASPDENWTLLDLVHAGGIATYDKSSPGAGYATLITALPATWTLTIDATRRAGDLNDQFFVVIGDTAGSLGSQGDFVFFGYDPASTAKVYFRVRDGTTTTQLDQFTVPPIDTTATFQIKRTGIGSWEFNRTDISGTNVYSGLPEDPSGLKYLIICGTHPTRRVHVDIDNITITTP